jgi:hypothetical protein
MEETVSNKFKSLISYKVIFVIVAANIVAHYYGVLSKNDLFVYVFSIACPVTAGISSLIVSKGYSTSTTSKVFQRGFFCLGIALFFTATGDFIYFIYDTNNSYPSIADIFYFPFYPLVITYLLLNIRFFKYGFPKVLLKKDRMDLAWLISIPSTIFAFYIFLSDGLSYSVETLLSDYYVAIVAISLSLSIYTVKIFKEGALGRPWLLLLFGILAFDIADIIYYHLESINSYDALNPINMLWNIGYLIIVYSLIKHDKIMAL